MKKTAILVDGAFYRNRAFSCLGDKSPSDRAIELSVYCHRHLQTINRFIAFFITSLASYNL